MMIWLFWCLTLVAALVGSGMWVYLADLIPEKEKLPSTVLFSAVVLALWSFVTTFVLLFRAHVLS